MFKQLINILSVHLKVLVVVRIDAETGDEAVHHELHVSVLAARPPPEGLGRVEQQSLVGQGGPGVTPGRSKAHFIVAKVMFSQEI